ncbi:response regulator [Terasakiella sp. A23]|uniref:response regulator n=1 Tax=Terasakiella sp. FCG-A23 TaxID=3080561 RepID=UPI002955CDBB|nr:response regulator [Terasakiella sp. A23]MDV7341250.1 response regulator [Terasakiella sp. A23]
MTDNNILVVDDDPITRETLQAYFSDEGYCVHTAEDCQQMEQVLASKDIDLIFLDINLPDKDGLTITRELRANSEVGIVLITARTDQIDRIIGLEMGADDYVTKPFEPRELLARCRSLLRRIQSDNDKLKQNVLFFKGWKIYLEKRKLIDPAGNQKQLTTTEFNLLAVFVQNAGRVLSRDTLLDLTPRTDDEPFDRTIDRLVHKIRLSIEDDPADPQLLQTVYGSGYIFTYIPE